MGRISVTSYDEVPVYETKQGAMQDAEGNWFGEEWDEQVGTRTEGTTTHYYYCDNCGSFDLAYRKYPQSPQEPRSGDGCKFVLKLFRAMLSCVLVAGILAVQPYIRDPGVRGIFYILAAIGFIAVLVHSLAAYKRISRILRAPAERKAYEKRLQQAEQTPFCRCKTCGRTYQKSEDLSDENPRNYTENNIPKHRVESYPRFR